MQFEFLNFIQIQAFEKRRSLLIGAAINNCECSYSFVDSVLGNVYEFNLKELLYKDNIIYIGGRLLQYHLQEAACFLCLGSVFIYFCYC